MSTRCFLITLILLCHFSAPAQRELDFESMITPQASLQRTPPNVNPDSLMLDSILVAYKESQQLPGVATLIIKEDKVIWNKNYGYRNLALQLPVEDSTLFLVGSISKTIVATAIMQLWEKGLIDLYGSVNNYLPAGFTVANPNHPGDTITVWMLMTHTSSLRDNWDFMDRLWGCGDYAVPYDTFLVNYFTEGGRYYSRNNFYTYPLGRTYNYSNAGSCLLALVVEQVSGRTFQDYTRDSILTPLDMNRSSWFLAGMDTFAIATPYMHRPPRPLCQTGMAYWPIGQLRTNKFELANLLRAYMNGGVFNGHRILKGSTIEMMLTAQQSGGDTIPSTPGGVHGLIWYTDPEIFEPAWGHSGGWYGNVSWMFCNPSERWGLVLLVNWCTPPDYTTHWPTPEMAQFAHLSGNVHAQQPNLEKTYARVRQDSIRFQTRFSNIHDRNFTPHLIWVSSDGTRSDSLTLYDDGLHGDSLSNDGVFGGHIPPQQDEDLFSVGVSTFTQLVPPSTTKYFGTPDISRFTTAGPLTLDSVVVDDFLSAYILKPHIRNQGASFTVRGAGVRLTCSDPWVKAISSSWLNLPDLAPGTSSGTQQIAGVSADTAGFPGYFNVRAEMRVDGVIYWSDSMRVDMPTGIDDGTTIPTAFALSQNYPNPFNPVTKIRFTIADRRLTILSVYDLLGREVATLVNEVKEPGAYEVQFDASRLASGVYLYQLRAGGYVETRRLVILR